MNNIEEINNIWSTPNRKYLYTIKLIKNIDKSHDKINKYKLTNINKYIRWCQNNNIEYNLFDDLVTPKYF